MGLSVISGVQLTIMMPVRLDSVDAVQLYHAEHSLYHGHGPPAIKYSHRSDNHLFHPVVHAVLGKE